MKKKILLVIPTLNQGGAERVISELANYWSTNGIEIHLAILVKSNHFYSLNNSITLHDIGKKINGKLSKIVSIFQSYYKLRTLIKNSSFNFIISFLPQSNVLTLFSALGLKQKIYVSERNSPTTWNDHSKSFIFIRNYLYKYAEGFIAQTNDAKNVLSKMYPIAKIDVIPNPIKEIKLNVNVKRENIILNVGRLDKQKGQLDLIEAFYKANLKNWKLIILGEGSLRKELENRIIELNLISKVEMPGAVKNIDEWYSKSSIFAFPSYFEGFPNALAEAMTSGLACVSYDCDTGPRDMIIENFNGYLISVGNIEKFSLKLKELAEKEDLREHISLNAIKIAEKFNIKNITNDILNLLYKDK